MSISKTEQTFVDVARKLFAKNGLEGTTMNDIARESGKGRRTLYTYFSKKEDIYSAVIESELERLSEKLDEVAAKKIRPQDKIIELIYTHLNMIRETVVRNGNLRAEFFRNIWMVEKVRKKFDADEIALFRKVYQSGVQCDLAFVTDLEGDSSTKVKAGASTTFQLGYTITDQSPIEIEVKKDETVGAIHFDKENDESPELIDSEINPDDREKNAKKDEEENEPMKAVEVRSGRC